MGQINMGRVVLGGLLAGLIINAGESILNLVLVADRYEAWVAELGLEPTTGAALGVYVVMGFVIGIVVAFVYAAIRPRFGPGPRTAVVAGVTVWFLAWFWPGISFGLFLGSFPVGLIAISFIWSLIQVIVAALAAGKIYAEGGAGAAATV